MQHLFPQLNTPDTPDPEQERAMSDRELAEFYRQSISDFTKAEGNRYTNRCILAMLAYGIGFCLLLALIASAL